MDFFAQVEKSVCEFVEASGGIESVERTIEDIKTVHSLAASRKSSEVYSEFLKGLSPKAASRILSASLIGYTLSSTVYLRAKTQAQPEDKRGISLWTVQAIQGNDVQVFDTPDRSEAWLMEHGNQHALLLSCPLDKRAEMEEIIASIKASPPSFSGG